MELPGLVEESRSKSKNKNKSNIKSSGQGCPLHAKRASLLQGFDYGVVEFGADLFDGLVGGVGPGAVGQQSY
jgi:hypothetical protein